MSTRYITLTTIHKTVTPGKRKTLTEAGSRPEIKEIAPGTIIVIDDALEAKELVGLGAIRVPTEEELHGKNPEDINSLSLEQIELAAADRADLDRLRADEAARKAAGGGASTSTTEPPAVDPVDALTTHAKLDEYLAAKGYTVQGWNVEGGVKTVADKQTALRNANKAAAEEAAAASSLV